MPSQRLEAGEQQLARVRVDEGDGDVRDGAQRARPRATSASRAASTRVHRLLPLEPREQVAHPVLERDLGAEPEPLLGEPRVGEAVPDVAGAVLLDDLGLDLLAEAGRDRLRDLEDRRRPAGAEVQRAAVRAVRAQRERAAAHQVAHVDEVARLPAVLEHERGVVVQQPRREDRRHAGVRVRKRLPLAVDVEEAERDGGDAVGGPDREEQLLVVALVHRVDGGRAQRLRLGRRLGVEWPAVVALHVPLLRGELDLGPEPGSDPRLARARVQVLALAVDRHRRGDDKLADRLAPLDGFLEDDRGADRVDRGVPLDLVHRLADADGGGEVVDGVDALERAPDGLVVADVADLELDGRVEVLRSLPVRVDLRIEVVEGPNLVPLREQPVGQMRADEAGTAGDQDLHRGVRLAAPPSGAAS